MNKKTTSHHQVKDSYSNCCSGSIVRKARALLLPLSLIGVVALLPVASYASDLDRQKNLNTLYEYSGVHAHLSWAEETVRSEAQQAHESCSETEKLPDVSAALDGLLSPGALQEGFLKQLDERINPTQLNQIIAFTQSDIGQRMFKAEAESISLDEARFDTILTELRSTGAIDQARITALKHLLADTGAVYFLSALNTELSSLVSMTSICSTDQAAIDAANILIRKERGAEALYRSFMRGELVLPAAVVYRELSDNEIAQVSTFAKTEAGNAYYSALIKGVRALLVSKVDELTLALQAAVQKD